MVTSTTSLRGRSSDETEPVARVEPPSSAAGLPHLRPLDGLRGLAVARVVAYHLAPSAVPGGFLGVDVFFVLSGFLITSLLIDEVGGSGRISLWRFYLRRIRRLAPALVVVLAALALYAATLATRGELGRLRLHGLWTLGYLANWRFIADGTTYTDMVAGASPLRHTWSLAIEEQFYVVFPVIVVVAGAAVSWRTGALRRALVIVAVLGSAASVAAMVALYDSSDPSRSYYGTDTRAHALLVGVALGALLVGRPPVRGTAAWVARWAALVGVVFLAVSVAVAHETSAWLYRGGFLAVALATAAIVASIGSSRTVQVVLSWRPLVGLGLISYGVYLWHWPLIVILDEERTGLAGVELAGARIAATLALSLLSYRLVEQPIRRGALGRRFGRGAIAAAPLAALGVVVALLWCTTAADAVPNSAAFVPRRTSRVVPAAAESHGTPAPSPTPVTVPPVARPHRVLMVGDSVAHTLAGGTVGDFPDFVRWSPAQSPFDPSRTTLWSAARPACSYLPGKVGSKAHGGAARAGDLGHFCGDWRTDIDRDVTGHDSEMMLVALENDVSDRYVGKRFVAFDSVEYQAMLSTFLDELRTIAARHGTTFVLLALPPRSGRFSAPDDTNGWRETRLAALERAYAAGHPEVRLLDLGTQICPAGDCAHPVAGFRASWRYDGEHYDGDGARWVAAWLSDRFDELDPSGR